MISYSEEGRVVCIIYRGGDGAPCRLVERRLDISEIETCPGWILLSRLRGRVLREEDLEGSPGEQLMRQLARYKAECRLQPPPMTEIGNLRLSRHSEDSSLQQSSSCSTFPGLPDCRVEGLLLCSTQPSSTTLSAREYYKHRLEDQSTIMQTEDVFTPNRTQIVRLVKAFTADTLPRLLVTSQPENSVFTHYDFSPRNVLVSTTSPPQITGIVDFEFAGFFPHEEDFVNDAVDNAGDWPEPSYKVFLDELEKCGVKTPLRGLDGRLWREAVSLRRLTENIAPWRLRPCGVEGSELRTALDRAAHVVEDCIDELRSLVAQEDRNVEL